jgi:hypothetical protein
MVVARRRRPVAAPPAAKLAKAFLGVFVVCADMIPVLLFSRPAEPSLVAR